MRYVLELRSFTKRGRAESPLGTATAMPETAIIVDTHVSYCYWLAKKPGHPMQRGVYARSVAWDLCGTLGLLGVPLVLT